MTETRTTADIELVYTAGAVRLGTRPMVAKDEFRGWLNEIRAEAWDEGYWNGLADGQTGYNVPENPYRPNEK